ncbi:MAG: L-serine ammonia-lyase, iron-sulfur-dependent, subunit alpha [Erysipelotrichales bacterium]|nr:L-serine ammonia-lyase, iron-sulfur-dependent, subunit alpha [Erysipelotrichales bacterium]
MESLKELFKIGPGPSSSHTVGPRIACLRFKEKYPDVDKYQVDLYGSLSLTGKGHYTDYICSNTLYPTPTQVYFHDEFQEEHPNVMELRAYVGEEEKGMWRVASVGGGTIQVLNECDEREDVYPEKLFDEIQLVCEEKKISLFEYVMLRDRDIMPYMKQVYQTMKESIHRGLTTQETILPGFLKFPRMAKNMYKLAIEDNDPVSREKSLITSYAFAATEENAGRGTVVTAPTLGSCGVLPAILVYFEENKGVSEEKILEALCVGGLFGNLVKHNATISGAEGGCQAEIGVACAMASASAAYLMGLSTEQIGYAAEVGIEHHLGLTCDPVGGYVIIPCIERNGVAALRALDAAHYAKTLGGMKKNFVSFDAVVRTMRNTGKSLPMELRETSLGGLAVEVKVKHSEE